MTIKLNYNGSDYSIVVEAQQFIAQKHGINNSKGDNNGKPTTRDIGYFSKVSDAVKKIIQVEDEATDEQVTLLEYCERIEKAYKDLMSQTDL